MGNSAKGIVIYDAQYNDAGKKVTEYANELSEMIMDYCTCLKKITETAIQDVRISNRLAGLAERMIALQEPLSNVAETASKASGQYITDIDAADQFLY